MRPVNDPQPERRDSPKSDRKLFDLDLEGFKTSVHRPKPMYMPPDWTVVRKALGGFMRAGVVHWAAIVLADIPWTIRCWLHGAAEFLGSINDWLRGKPKVNVYVSNPPPPVIALVPPQPEPLPAPEQHPQLVDHGYASGKD
jgi:hypothetical protein